MKKIAFVFVLMLSGLGLGAADAGADVMAACMTALGLALNAGGVWFLVFLVNKYRPMLRKKAPHWIPLIAIVAGPLLNALAALVLQYAGVEIDFSMLIAALAGTGAVTLDQMGRQFKKRVRPSRLPA